MQNTDLQNYANSQICWASNSCLANFQVRNFQTWTNGWASKYGPETCVLECFEL